MLFPPLDKRNTRDKAKGLCITSERHIGTLGVRCREALRRVARCMGEIFAPLHYYRTFTGNKTYRL